MEIQYNYHSSQIQVRVHQFHCMCNLVDRVACVDNFVSGQEHPSSWSQTPGPSIRIQTTFDPALSRACRG